MVSSEDLGKAQASVDGQQTESDGNRCRQQGKSVTSPKREEIKSGRRVSIAMVPSTSIQQYTLTYLDRAIGYLHEILQRQTTRECSFRKS